MEEIILMKIESIEKCLSRIDSKVATIGFDLGDYDTQDIIVLNLQRACQQAIDLAIFIVTQLNYGIPKDSANAFDLLHENSVIGLKTKDSMRGMVGFRNVAVHEYQRINNDIVYSVITTHLNDFRDYNRQLINNYCN